MSRLAEGCLDETYIDSLSFTLSVFAWPCFGLRLPSMGLFISASYLLIAQNAWETWQRSYTLDQKHGFTLLKRLAGRTQTDTLPK